MIKLADITSKYRASLMADVYKRWVKKGDRILDVGCGTGVVGDYLSKELDVIVEGCDIEKYLIRNMKYKKVTKTNRLPYKENEFDATMLNDMLHHTTIDTQKALIKESTRVSKKVLLFEVLPSPKAKLFDYILNKIHHSEMDIPFTFHSESEWKKMFKDLGLKTKTRKVKTPFLYPFDHIAFCLQLK